MLSRVADSLYWMSRYLERAEHSARLIEVNLNLMLDESSSSADRRWKRVLTALGDPERVRMGRRCVCARPPDDVRWREPLVHHLLHHVRARKCPSGARTD